MNCTLNSRQEKVAVRAGRAMEGVDVMCIAVPLSCPLGLSLLTSEWMKAYATSVALVACDEGWAEILGGVVGGNFWVNMV